MYKKKEREASTYVLYLQIPSHLIWLSFIHLYAFIQSIFHQCISEEIKPMILALKAFCTTSWVTKNTHKYPQKRKYCVSSSGLLLTVMQTGLQTPYKTELSQRARNDVLEKQIFLWTEVSDVCQSGWNSCLEETEEYAWKNTSDMCWALCSVSCSLSFSKHYVLHLKITQYIIYF